MKLQNTATENTLNTVTHRKNTIPRPATWLSNNRWKPSRHRMKKPNSTGRNTRRGKRLTKAPYSGCAARIRTNEQVDSTCRIISCRERPRWAKNAIIAGGNTASTSLEAPIASRTGRNT